jgi:hypothetical protein
MKLEKFKITWGDVFGAMVDIAFMSVRPIVFWLIWNYGLSANTTIPKLDILQVISIIIIFHILISYVPLYLVKSNDDE